VRARHAILRLLDAGLDPAARLVTPIAPVRAHPGHRACRARADAHAAHAQGVPDLAAAVLAARWRCALLLAHVGRLAPTELRHFLASRVEFAGDLAVERAVASERPLILATPHTGASLIACLAVVRRFQHRREFGVLYRHAPRSASISSIFCRAGARATFLSGVGGVIRGIEILQRGGCVATMPDVFDDVVDTIAVPFCGRWLRVAAGLSFLAHRSQALILPAYVTTERGPRVRAYSGAPIEPREFASGDVRQEIFVLTCRLFAQIERQLRDAPEHWLYWERLPRVSTPLESAPVTDASAVAAALAQRCRANPGLLRRVPELAALIAGALS